MKLLFSKSLGFFLLSCLYFHHPKPSRDERQYPKGMDKPLLGSLEQLSHYPLPRYYPNHTLSYLFNWSDPMFFAGSGQPGVERYQALFRSELIQKELCLNWHYGIVIPNAECAFNSNGSNYGACPAYVRFANEHPEIPLDVITYWMASEPNLIGYPYTKAMIVNTDLNKKWDLTFDIYGSSHTEINYTFPDSLIRIDGAVQKFYFTRILKWLKRPVTRINENGEEPPGPYMLNAIKSDPATKHMKDSMKIDSWVDFMAIRKLQMRMAYRDAFMKSLPELKHTLFSMYTIEGGPVDRYKWSVMKKIQSPTSGIYYSTPDFYPRWPKNWKEWTGPWHGWSWIDHGRKTEIKDGDKLFSPFISAGWSAKQEEDIRPGQWLGLLKCLGVIGAEYYYTCYFNLGTPFNNPATYVWQEAMPAYAQGITSRFEDVLRDGNVLFEKDGTPRITWTTEDRHVLITVRKHSKKEKYIICGTYQPFSNDANEIPEKRNVKIHLGEEELSFEIRRQGSVYVYEKTAEGKILFYQLDTWHENAHPDYWTREFRFEAEVADSKISNEELTTTHSGDAGDYTASTTSVQLKAGKNYTYVYSKRDSANNKLFVWIRYKGQGALIVAGLKKEAGDPASVISQLPVAPAWKWYRIQLPAVFTKGISLSLEKGSVELDKMVVKEGDEEPH
ncbi:MAG: hypothetical protein ACHQRM_00485 [Bacteroidia bacterium]